ncbi:alpha-2-macroglobulin family protein [Maribacter sp. X9]|uniref:alpha-2-macroglobulin family protein n=1 Tax=Maribacter sp. X9 TaxID=3402159 RepID=UPI003AF3BCA5
MKNVYFILSIILFAQFGNAQNNDPFESLWKKVQKLEEQALTKSALNEVENIYEKAKADKNEGQLIKALLYKSKFSLILEEDAQLSIVNDFKEEIEKAESPTKNILHSYLANLYWQYFQQNRYRFYNRTTTEAKVDSVDFRTWDLTTIFKEIDIHFKTSLENSIELQKTNISQFNVILNEQENSNAYRPTLFDLLAHNALDFYTTSENSINKPAYNFEIASPELLCEAYSFSFINMADANELSLQAKSLELYSRLIAFHFGNPDMKPLVLADIERLNFIHEHATFNGKDDLYLEVLKNSEESIKNSPISALYTYEIAHHYQKQGLRYNPKTDTEHQWKLKEAIALCDRVIATFPKSLGADKCRALKSQIEAPSLQITSEKHIPNNTIARLLVSYKNYSNLNLTAYKITQEELAELDKLYPEEKRHEFIQQLALVKSWSTSLKTEYEYQTHSTEISMPPLENGYYTVLASPMPKDSNAFAYATVQVTDLALIETQTETHTLFQVIDRTNGQAVQDAEITFSYRTNYDGRKKHQSFNTDQKGGFSITKNRDTWSNIDITVKKGQDKAYFSNYNINRSNPQNTDQIRYSCFLFTDRSIYRPGQTLYFKGIAVRQEEGKSSILKQTSVEVKLQDVNGQEVTTQSFMTNEFGSFSGEFILPANGLTGNFSLKVDSDDINLYGYTSFSVEEYKRPKFETSFEPVTETYRINDSIKLVGKATAYAGSAISDAKVTYRVKRVVYFPKWYYWSRPYFNGTPQEIAHGETTTDSSGNYQIEFKAIPDPSIDKKNLPTFNYEVTADVTDINGETRSTTTLIKVGYHALNVDLIISETLNKNSDSTKFSIASSNLNGEFVPADGDVKLYKLKAPENVLRPRPWPAPDYPGFTKDNFKKIYPHDAFTNEDDPINWKKGNLVWESSFDTEKSKVLDLGNIKKWETGYYKMELEAKDKFGQTVKDVALINLTSNDDKKPTDNQLLQIKTDKTQYAAGEEAKITFLSGAKNITISVTVEKNHEVVDSVLVTLNGNSKTIKLPVTANDLGGFSVHYSYAFANHFESNSYSIKVPYPSSDLQIETVSFRDKIAPGTEETWSFTVKGPKGDKVSAELLASMYDASLDQFKGHTWDFNPLNRSSYYSYLIPNAYNSFSINSFNTYQNYGGTNYTPLHFDSLNWFGLHFGYGGLFYDQRTRKMSMSLSPANAGMMENEAVMEEVVTTSSNDLAREDSDKDSSSEAEVQQEKADFDSVVIRKNLQETAFFFPKLLTDKEGNVSFSFTTPEALTRWNLQLLAHTKELESTIKNLSTVTQKELMVLPNAPRFLREGDTIVISSKISNLTDKVLKGSAKLELTDGLTGKDISQQLIIPFNTEQASESSFQVDSLGNIQVAWRLAIPEELQSVQYKIVAKAGDYSDGEQNMLPVLTNRILVTETLPLWVRSNQTKNFALEKLRDNTSTTLTNHKLTLEITSNPAWYAVQALPYLMEYPYECSEQTFAKYYANTLASHIANSNPRIRKVFEQWANSDALLSNLEKNEELKSLLIQETPWLRDAQSETEQKKRIGLLFNLNKIKNEQRAAISKLKQNQKSSGAWPWFNGGPDNRYITQHIITGLGHLNHLNITTAIDGGQSDMVEKALSYLEIEFIKEYEQMKKHTSNMNEDHLSVTQIEYLYMTSFFNEFTASKKAKEITDYYKGQAQKYWMNKGLLSQGMLALALHRMDDTNTANKILRSLDENSITSDELGMYWKKNTSSWNWYQAPIETQALLIEVFSEIRPTDTKTIDNLKIWLLKNKQTNQWSTTKATTAAIYALLLQGNDWLSITENVDVLVEGKKIQPATLENVKTEAGTGYFKTSWNGTEIEPKMANVQFSKKGEGIAWGALYWQYFEDLDKITSAETPLKLKKKLFLKKNTATGEIISEITEKTSLHVGDLVRIRIELKSDRDMEFIHMKDMRAAGFEPVNVLSQYKWQDGLGYYESTKDASTNFFFDFLPKGVYIFEYDVRVNNAGEFSNGITSIQSMYAPEFSSHSEGVRVTVE